MEVPSLADLVLQEALVIFFHVLQKKTNWGDMLFS